MAIIKPFTGYRPKKDLVSKIASRPYDVLNTEEAREEAKDNPHSFLHVVKPEIDLPEDVDHYDEKVYLKARENLKNLINKGDFFRDEKPCYYIYAQTLWGNTQYGLVGCAAVDDYLNNVVKKHELTRPDKEKDRKNHIRYTNFQAEPVFFTYPDNETLNRIVSDKIVEAPVYDFDSGDGVVHKLWVIDEDYLITKIEDVFRIEVPATYVADGHHRTAAAAHVGEERRKQNKNHTGTEAYNYFMAVHFPASQLTIIDYNRVVTDLNGLTTEQFLERLKAGFEIIEHGEHLFKPERLHQFSMYLDGNWYELRAKDGTYDDSDPIGALDVTVLSKQILDPVLDIKDLRKSKRIDFVGGIRGLEALKKRVDSGEMAVAFALYPVSMGQLITIADTGNIMPPKTTWFEPKLRSGLVLHSIE